MIKLLIGLGFLVGIVAFLIFIYSFPTIGIIVIFIPCCFLICMLAYCIGDDIMFEYKWGKAIRKLRKGAKYDK
jgi:hypothetical protein